MNEILQYLGGGSVISGLLLWWVKSTISTLSAKIEKSENDNIKQEGDIKRLQEDVQRIKDKIYK